MSPRVRSTLRAWSRVESVITVSLVGLVGFVASPRLEHAATYLRYRVVMEDVATQIRSMSCRSSPEQLHIDTAHGMMQFVIQRESPQPYEIVRRTVWLPEGLEFSESGMVMTFSSDGRGESSSIVVTAPAYQRAFRIIMHDGQVTLHEEPTS